MCIFSSLLVSPWLSLHGERKPITFFSLLNSWQPHHNAVIKAHGSPALHAAHCALEAVVVVAAAPLAEATVKREFWMDSAEVEEA